MGSRRSGPAKSNEATGGPLSEPVFLILSSVSDRPRHGYAILSEVEQLSDGRVRLSTGTLYGAIRRLLEAGWIERHDEAHPPTGDRPRHVYRITRSGRSVLKRDVDRMARLVELGRARFSWRAT